MHWLIGNAGDVECLFIGEGPELFGRQLRNLADSGPGATHIHWLGMRTDVLSLLTTCMALVCPSHAEPLGRVIYEAWDAGAVPVACKSSGGAAEIIAAADGGILYAEQTPASLAQALLAAMRLPPDEAARLVANGRLWMAQHCDQAAYGAAMAKILDDAAVANRHP